MHYIKTHVYMKFKWNHFLGIYKNVIFSFLFLQMACIHVQGLINDN